MGGRRFWPWSEVSFLGGLLALGGGVGVVRFLLCSGLSFPGGLLVFGRGFLLSGFVVLAGELFPGDYWLLGVRCNLSILAAPGIEFSWGFTGFWERGIVYSARLRAKRSLAGGLLMILAVFCEFRVLHLKPCLAGGLLSILAFLRDSLGRGGCARDFPGARISFSGAGSSSRGPQVPKKPPKVPPEVPGKVENM